MKLGRKLEETWLAPETVIWPSCRPAGPPNLASPDYPVKAGKLALAARTIEGPPYWLDG